jgi:hypothetical protein
MLGKLTEFLLALNVSPTMIFEHRCAGHLSNAIAVA